jgi:hypothetical protein
VREKPGLDIILQVMKCEPKIIWKSKRNKSNEVLLVKLDNALEMIL